MDYDVDRACINRFPILSEGFEMIVFGHSPTF